MADCEGCKWHMGLGYDCLLGRAADNCNNDPARRGDDELVQRLLSLSDGEKDDLRQRFETAGDDGLGMPAADSESTES